MNSSADPEGRKTEGNHMCIGSQLSHMEYWKEKSTHNERIEIKELDHVEEGHGSTKRRCTHELTAAVTAGIGFTCTGVPNIQLERRHL